MAVRMPVSHHELPNSTRSKLNASVWSIGMSKLRIVMSSSAKEIPIKWQYGNFFATHFTLYIIYSQFMIHREVWEFELCEHIQILRLACYIRGYSKMYAHATVNRLCVNELKWSSRCMPIDEQFFAIERKHRNQPAAKQIEWRYVLTSNVLTQNRFWALENRKYGAVT